ncbi:unnamed protein product [Closterium sp. NIES-65]|nr:unnamed protein product [Closterium sp. NIES-65]
MRVVRSRKKEREAPEARVKVCKALPDVVPERADSPAPGAADSLVPGAADLRAPRAAAAMPGSGGTHRELETPGVSLAAKAALGGVRPAARLPSAVTSTQDVGIGTSTPRRLLGWQGLTRALLLLTLATTEASPRHRATPNSATAIAASSTPTATAAAASAAATRAPFPATTPTATPTPSAPPTATTTSPARSPSALAPSALAVAAPHARDRRSAD